MTTIHLGVGDPLLSIEDIECLPPGSVMRETTGSQRYTRMDDGSWARGEPMNRNRHGEYTSSSFSTGGYNTVHSLPEGTITESRPAITYSQYLWKFRDGVMAGTVRANISREPVLEALRKLGVDQVPPIGPGVGIRNPLVRDTLPEGTLIYSGDPQMLGTFGVWRHQGGSWVRVLGRRTEPGYRSTVIEVMPGVDEPPEWVTATATPADEEQIRAFKAKAWQVGWETKRNQSWCSEFEAVMNSVGVTAESLDNVLAYNGVALGTSPNRAECRGLPVGSVLTWSSGEAWAVYVRVEESGNAYGTRRIAGHHPQGQPLAHCREAMRLAWINADEYRTDWFRLGPIHQVHDHLPPGTVFACQSSPNGHYGICNDGTSRYLGTRVTEFDPSRSGEYAAAAFSSEDLYIIRFPEVSK